MRKFERAVFSLIVVALYGCGKGPEQRGPAPVPVSVYEVVSGTATYADDYPATVTPLNQVDIRAEVSGYITGIYFKDGSHVARGTRLYAIDQRQYKAGYDQASANLNVARANLAKIQQDADRYKELAKEDAVARQTLDHALADLDAAKMQVAAAEATVKSAETNLRFAEIYAPFDCTVGFSQVKIGSAVTAGQTLLTTVSSDNPVAVEAAVDEKQIGRFSHLLGSKAAVADSQFTIMLPDQKIYPFPGRLSFMDRAVDPQTGTIRIRVVFPNAANILKPGLSCNLLVKAESADSSVLIPFKAVVEQMGEYFVYVVNNDHVSQRKINLGMRIQGNAIVREGLKAGEQIVTEGVQKLRDNSAVQVPAQPLATSQGSRSTSSPDPK